MTIWICGNSHTGALRKAQQEAGGDLDALRIFPFGNGYYETEDYSTIQDAEVVITHPKFIPYFKKFTGGSHFSRTDLWGLVLGTHSGAIYQHPMWGRAEPSEIARAGTRPISAALLDAIIEQRQAPTRDLIRSLTGTGIPAFVIECPRPRRDHPRIEAGTRAETIAYIDARFRELFRNFLRTTDVDLVSCPPETYSDDGFMRPQFYKKTAVGEKPDQHHANAAYGVIVLDKVMEYLRARYPEHLAASA